MENIFYIISALLGILLITFGYLIKFKKKTNLINDYKIKNIKDEEGYVNHIGKVYLLVGEVILVSTILAASFDKIVMLAILDGVLIITLIILLVSGEKNYRAK